MYWVNSFFSFGGISTRMTLRIHHLDSFHRCSVTGWFHVLLYLNYSSVLIRTDQAAQAVSHRAHSAYLTIPGRELLPMNRGRCVLQGTGGVSTAFASGQQNALHHRRADLEDRNEACRRDLSFKRSSVQNARRYQCSSLAHSQTLLWGSAQWPTRIKCRGGMSN